MKIRVIEGLKEGVKSCTNCCFSDFNLDDFPCNECAKDASYKKWRPKIPCNLPSEAEKRLSDERMKSYIVGFKDGWNSAIKEVMKILNI